MLDRTHANIVNLGEIKKKIILNILLINLIFSFKTKGNLTKHMKSKAHFKKCTELGLNPIPTSLPDDDGNEFDDSASMTSEKTSRRGGLNKENESRVGSNYNGDSETDDGEESEDETDSDDG